MKYIYHHIIASVATGKKMLVILIDPDKTSLEEIPDLMAKVKTTKVSYIFVGGSDVAESLTDAVVKALRKLTDLPIVLFPGDVTQITSEADAILFLSLVSGRDPDYLIGKHVSAVPVLRSLALEVIPTGYLLIENGKETSVQRVTGTLPMKRTDVSLIVDTAKASEYLGMKLIYLEAGSGASHPITQEIISAVKQDLNIPLIVGGGIRTKSQLEAAFNAGADMVVIGTAFEQDMRLFDELKS